MQLTLIGPHERKKIAELIELARAKPVDMKGLSERLKLPKIKAAHMAQMTAQTIDIPVGYQATFSFETGHPVGLCRHMSISTNRPNQLPAPEAAWRIAQEFGFTGSLLECHVWVEELKGHGAAGAVNLVQAVPPTH